MGGATAGFGEADAYVVSLARNAFAKGLTIGGTKYSVEILNRDSQSAPSHAAQVANDLIRSDGVEGLTLRGGIRQRRDGFGIETIDRGEQSPETGAENISPLREEGVER